MNIIRNAEFGGERPLFASHDLHLDNVTIHAGESALKECSHIVAENSRFEGKYDSRSRIASLRRALVRRCGIPAIWS